MNVAPYIDHTLLKPTTVLNDIKVLCSEAREFGFAAVCVPPRFVKHAATMLQQTEVQTATVIGFPFGYSVLNAKICEVEQAIQDGADELDVVINISALKDGEWTDLKLEANRLLEPICSNGKLIKVIIESGVLSDEEIIRCCEIYGEVGVDYVKTSTGYAETGATLKAVQLMRRHLPSGIKIKASGGIRTYEAAKMYIEAGATRIGCSAGVAIMKEQSLLS